MPRRYAPRNDSGFRYSPHLNIRKQKRKVRHCEPVRRLVWQSVPHIAQQCIGPSGRQRYSRKRSFIRSFHPILPQIFPVAGLDHGRLWVGHLPGHGLFLFLFLQKNLPLFGSSLPERGSFYPIIPESLQKASGRLPADPQRRGFPVRRHPGRRGSNTPGWPDSLRSRQGRCLRTAAPSGKAAGQHRC